jgi:hypothetical protein
VHAGLNTFLEMVPLPAIAWAIVAVTCVIHFVMIETSKVAVRQMMNKGVWLTHKGTSFFEQA